MKRILATLALAVTLAHAQPEYDPSITFVSYAIGTQHGWEITTCPPGLETFAQCSYATGNRELISLQIELTLTEINGTWLSPWVPSSDNKAYGRLARVPGHGEILFAVIPEPGFRNFITVTRLK